MAIVRFTCHFRLVAFNSLSADEECFGNDIFRAIEHTHLSAFSSKSLAQFYGVFLNRTFVDMLE
jgi:hypothetical protein